MGLTAKLPSKQQFLEVNGVGEPLIDAVTSPEGTSEHPGGSPANVAYGLGRKACRKSSSSTASRVYTRYSSCKQRSFHSRIPRVEISACRVGPGVVLLDDPENGRHLPGVVPASARRRRAYARRAPAAQAVNGIRPERAPPQRLGWKLGKAYLYSLLIPIRTYFCDVLAAEIRSEQ